MTQHIFQVIRIIFQGLIHLVIRVEFLIILQTLHITTQTCWARKMKSLKFTPIKCLTLKKHSKMMTEASKLKNTNLLKLLQNLRLPSNGNHLLMKLFRMKIVQMMILLVNNQNLKIKFNNLINRHNYPMINNLMLNIKLNIK